MSFSTTKLANVGACSSPDSVRASSVTPNDMSVPALEMNVFRPLISQPPSRRTARVRMPRASEPASGSVSPNAPRTRPSANGRSQRSRCASVPKRYSGNEPMVTCACHAAATDWSARPSLLHRGDEADGRHADAAPLLGDQHAEQAQRTHLAEQVGRAPRLLPRERGTRGDLLLRELATEADQIAFRLGEREVHGRILLDRPVQRLLSLVP